MLRPELFALRLVKQLVRERVPGNIGYGTPRGMHRLDVSTVGGESEVQEHHAMSTALDEKTDEEAREASGRTNADAGLQLRRGREETAGAGRGAAWERIRAGAAQGEGGGRDARGACLAAVRLVVPTPQPGQARPGQARQGQTRPDKKKCRLGKHILDGVQIPAKQTEQTGSPRMNKCSYYR